MEDKEKEFRLEVKKQLADKLKEASTAFNDALTIYEALRTSEKNNLRDMNYVDTYDEDFLKLSKEEQRALESISDSLGNIISSLDNSGWNTSSLGC